MCHIISASVTERTCRINTILAQFCPVILQCVGTCQKFGLYPYAGGISHVWCHVEPCWVWVVCSKSTGVNM